MAEANYWARRASRRGILRGGAAVGVGATAWALAGCGDDDDKPTASASAKASASGASSTGTSSSSTGGGATAVASPTEQVKRGGTIVWPNAGATTTLDFHKTSSAYTNYYGSGNCYSGLVRPQATGHKNATIVAADLAEKWEQPDPTTYVFKLRPNVKWQNLPPVNGRVLTAQDIEYSFNRQVEQKVNGPIFAGVKSMKAVDATTYRIELNSPDVDFLETLTAAWNKVISKEAVEAKNGDLSNGPVVGTGPWIFKDYQKDVTQVFVKNPDYFIQGQPYLDGYSAPFFRDIANWEAQFREGKAHVIFGATSNVGIPLKTLKALDKTKYGIRQGLPVAPAWIMYQNNHPQIKDPRIRKGLAMAVDLQLINGIFDGEMAQDATGLVLPNRDWLLSKAEIDKIVPFDPKAAKQMIDAAGGLPKQEMPFFESPSVAQAAQLIQANWKAIGVETELKQVDPAGLTGTIFNPANSKFAMAVTAISHGPTFTADVEAWFVTNGARNGGHWSDAEVDDLTKKQKVEFDEKKRRELVTQIQRRIFDQVYHQSLGAIGAFWAFPSNLRGVEPTLGYGPHFQELWLA